MKLFKKAKKGFTLVELVVVIAVIAILAAVSVGAYFGVTDSANRSKLEQEARAAYEGIRLISLADPENNQSLDIDGLHIRNNDRGIPTFRNDLIYTTGMNYVVDDEIPTVDGQPTITDRTIVLRTDVYTESAVNSTAFNTYKTFNYYSNEVGKYYANVNIINGKIQILEDDFTTQTPDGDEETEVIALGSLTYEGTLSKSAYFEGEEFSEAGLTFYANYSNGTKVDVTDKVTFENRTLELNTTSVTASYTENNVTKTVSVTGFSVAKIVFKELVVEGAVLDTNYFEGESFKLDGLTFYEKNNKGDVDRENPIPHSSLTISPAELTYLTTSVTISYTKDGTTDTYSVNVNVQKVIPTTLTVSGTLTKNEYFVGEKVNLQGLTFSVEFNNGTRKDNVTNEVRLNSDTVIEGENTFTAYYEYNGERVECEISDVTGIAIVAQSLSYQGTLTKNTYIDGNSIDLNGLTFIVTKNNGDTFTVEDPENITSEPLATGQTEVEVTYNANGIEVSCTVSGFTVEAVALTGLSYNGTLVKKDYFDNEQFDSTGLTFTATYNNGNSTPVTPAFSGFQIGENITIRASYTENGITKSCDINDQNINVTKVVPVELNVSLKQSEEYFVGATLDDVKDGRTFTVTYNNNATPISIEPSNVNVEGEITAGQQEITFSFSDKDVTVSKKITVTFIEVSLDSTLTVTGELTKKTYYADETLSYDGLVFTATYNNGVRETVTPAQITLEEGQTSAIVTYTNDKNEIATATIEGFTVSAAPELEANVWYKATSMAYIKDGYKLIMTVESSRTTATNLHSDGGYLNMSSINSGYSLEENGTILNKNLPSNTTIFIIEKNQEGYKLKNESDDYLSIDSEKKGNLAYSTSNITWDISFANRIIISNLKDLTRELRYNYNKNSNPRIKNYSKTSNLPGASDGDGYEYISAYVCSAISSDSGDSGNVGGDTPEIPATEGWKLVTDSSTLKAGDRLVIASNVNGATAGDITNSFLSINDSEFSNDNTLITKLSENAIQFILGGSKDNWTLSKDDALLGVTAVKKVAWDNGTTTWKISITNNDAIIQSCTNSYGMFLYNAENPRFTTYTSGASDKMFLPQLYRYESGSTGGETPTPETPVLTSLVLSSNYSNAINPGDTITFTLQGLDANSNNFDLGDKTVAWTYNTSIFEETSKTNTQIILKAKSSLIEDCSDEIYAVCESISSNKIETEITIPSQGGDTEQQPTEKTVTYTVTGTESVKSSGDASGLTAKFKNTYSTQNQITGGNSATLTISNLNNAKIKSIMLSMKSNSSKGAGTFSAKFGNITIASIDSATNFNKWYNNTSYGTDYRDVKVTIDNTTFVNTENFNLEIVIAATVNSLYIQSYTIVYES